METKIVVKICLICSIIGTFIPTIDANYYVLLAILAILYDNREKNKEDKQ